MKDEGERRCLVMYFTAICEKGGEKEKEIGKCGIKGRASF